MPALPMCWPSPDCTWRWWAWACSGWCARVLARIPAMALQYPIKKWAAGAALAARAFISSSAARSASATRAFVMLAMMLLAILLDRPALSMRTLALAAAILLLAAAGSDHRAGIPDVLRGGGGLIAVAEWEQARERVAPRGHLYRYLRGIALTSLVGSLATLPFAIFNFGRATHYAVLGNLLAMPVMGSG